RQQFDSRNIEPLERHLGARSCENVALMRPLPVRMHLENNAPFAGSVVVDPENRVKPPELPIGPIGDAAPAVDSQTLWIFGAAQCQKATRDAAVGPERPIELEEWLKLVFGRREVG